jgi:hypothetical protein
MTDRPVPSKLNRVPEQGRRSLVVTIGLSILLHAAAGLAVVASDGSTQPPVLGGLPDDMRAPENQAVLGIERSNAVTIDWLGFSEDTPHIAEPADVNQAALSPAPAPSPADAPMQAAPAPSPEQPEAEPPTPEETAPSTAVAEPLPTPRLTDPSAAVVTTERTEPVETAAPQAIDDASERRPVDAAPEPSPAAQPEVQAETPDAGSAEQTAAGGAPGLQDERESDAASRKPIEFRQSQWGKPLAREGIQITTVRPRWSITTRVTSAPRNPTVEVVFGPDGKVRRAGFKRHTDGFLLSTGDSRVDQPLIDALYRWKAKGARIDDLGPGSGESSVTITLRIVLRSS